jgi:hypothetical protein
MIFISVSCFSQASSPDTVRSGSVGFSLTTMGIVTNSSYVPFWMRTNQHGSLPQSGGSAALIGTFYKAYRNPTDSNGRNLNKWDWSAGIEIRMNAGKYIEGQVIESFITAKHGVFEFALGRVKEQMGLVHGSLSSGAFSVSGNALGVPKLTVAVPEYWDIPFTKKLVALKGTFSLGYMGTVQLQDKNFILAREAHAIYHEKSLYGRFGKPDWRVQLFGGFNHQVMFGDEKEIFGVGYKLNVVATALYAITGKTYGNADVASSKIGNHLGSVDQALSIRFNKGKMVAYHQFFYDVGGLAHFNNLKDGLWGLSYTPDNPEKQHKVRLKTSLVEFLYSKSQGGELDAPDTPSGDEDYYNNWIYLGWIYQGENIGNNFLTNKYYMKKELPSYDQEFITNNRVMLLHVGTEWSFGRWEVSNKLSFTRNFGTYGTSPIGHSTGQRRTVSTPPYFEPVSQFSGYLSASRPLKNKLSLGFAVAVDYGQLLYNSIGGMIWLKKNW